MAQPVQGTSPDRYRWVIGMLLGVGVLVNYFDRVNLSVSHEALVHDFGISAAAFGSLSAAYSWTYALCQLPTGVLLDRLGVRKVTLGSVTIWAAASLAAAVSPCILFFFAARLLLGIGEAPTFPANAKAVGAWFPLAERSLATAIFDSAAKFANAIGVPLLGLLLLRVGWRFSFGFTAALSLGYLLLFAWLYREPLHRSLSLAHAANRNQPAYGADAPFRAQQVDTQAGYGSLQSGSAATTTAMSPNQLPVSEWTLPKLLRQRKVLGLALGFGSYNYVFYLLLTWLPTYLQQGLHLSSQRSFLYTGVPWLFATATDLLLGGVLVDALIRRGFDSSRVRRTALLCGMVCGLGILGGAYAGNVVAALVPISIAIGGLAVTAPVSWSIPALLVPNTSTGKVGSIINFASQLSGIAAPIVTGLTVSATGNFRLAFFLAGAYLLLGLAAYTFLLGRIEPIHLAT